MSRPYKTMLIAALFGITGHMAQAQVLSDAFPLPIACGEAAIGSAECPLEMTQNALDTLSPGFGQPYHEAGLESYAIMITLTTYRRVFNAISENDDCGIVNDGLYLIAESLNSYLPKTDELPAALADEYLVLAGFFANAFQYAETETC